MSEVSSHATQAPRTSIRVSGAMRLGLFFVLVSAGAAYLFVAHDRVHAAAKHPEAGAIPVVAGTVTTRDLPVLLSGVGTVLPLNVVDIKARVDGQLERVAFTEGQEVRAGDLLAQIDPRPFQAQLEQARANRAKDEAQLANTRVDLTRMSKLVATGVVPVQSVDALRAQVKSLEAMVQADQAAIDTAQLQLGFTRLTSPISGRVGLRLVNPGAIVHVTDATGIVTVTQIHPISVLFSLPQDQLPDILANSSKSKLRVVAYTRDGTRSLADGELTVVDSQIDPNNGQVRLKATFTNADRALWPGALVTVRLLVRTDHGATVVPARAVLRGQSGEYVYVVKPDKTVEMRVIQTGQTVDGFTAVRSGLVANEIVVFDGQTRLTPGTRVDVHPDPAATASSVARQGSLQ